MPLYRIELEERGVRYKTFTVTAADEEEATELVFNDEVEPETEHFDQIDIDTHIMELEDPYWELDSQTLEDLGL